MSRLELAKERLGNALESLEKAASQGADAPPGASGADAALAAAETERQTLLARIAELEEELVALSGVTQDVEGRLNGAIGEIRAALAR